MVQNKLHWDASYTVGLPKQRKVGLDWYDFLLFSGLLHLVTRDLRCISLALHGASLLRTIFKSLVRAHEHLRVQNVIHFRQTKLDPEINAPFVLNEQGDPHVLFHNFNENNILNI